MLVVGGGSRYSYFGHDEWAEHAPELKSLEGALDLRARILLGVRGGGGREGRGARAGVADVRRRRRRPDRRRDGRADRRARARHAAARLPRDGHAAGTVLLVEATDRLLGTFPTVALAQGGETSLRSLGVTPMLSTTVVGVDGDAVEIAAADGARSRIPARTVVWAAGVTASPLAGLLAEAAGGETDRAGRVPVEPDLTLAGHPEVFAIGDMVSRARTHAAPGRRAGGDAGGAHVARSIRTRRSAEPFRYKDKGNLATIGRSRAVADIKGLHFSGFLAWVLWLGLHLFYLVGFQNRLLVLTRWTFSYITRGRSARVIHRDLAEAPRRRRAPPRRRRALRARRPTSPARRRAPRGRSSTASPVVRITLIGPSIRLDQLGDRRDGARIG